MGFYLSTCSKERKISGVRVSAIKNFKKQITNTKWFDKLTTTLSQAEGQITMIEIQYPQKLAIDLI